MTGDVKFTDDYYGKTSYKLVHDYLVSETKDFCMAGFVLKNTLSDHGGVTRGICQIKIGELLKENKVNVKVLKTTDTRYGMTYKEDVVAVQESFKKLIEDGVYREDLYSNL